MQYRSLAKLDTQRALKRVESFRFTANNIVYARKNRRGKIGSSSLLICSALPQPDRINFDLPVALVGDNH